MRATIKKEYFFLSQEKNEFIKKVGKHNVISYGARNVSGVMIYYVTYYAD